jgi:hypothetical protein
MKAASSSEMVVPTHHSTDQLCFVIKVDRSCCQGSRTQCIDPTHRMR